MHTTGKVFVWLTVLLAVGALALSIKLLGVRSYWMEQVAKIKDDNTKLAESVAAKRLDLDRQQSELSRTLLGWDKYWTNVNTGMANPAEGILQVELGSNQGLAIPQGGTPPILQVFRPLGDGTFDYVGPFQAQQVLENNATLKSTWQPRPGEVQAWSPGPWRVRLLVPASHVGRFLDLQGKLTGSDELLAQKQQNIEIQNKIIADSQRNLNFRMEELVGANQPAGGGLLGAIEHEEQQRNLALAEVDGLRRELKAALEDQEKLLSANAVLMRKLPQPKSDVVTNVPGNQRCERLQSAAAGRPSEPKPKIPGRRPVFDRPEGDVRTTMGIYSRDYIRDTRSGGGFGYAGDAWAIRFLLVANVAVFLLQNLTGGEDGAFTRWLNLNPVDVVYHGQIWRLLTYGFCHSTTNLLHLVFNMYVLWMFGRLVEPIYGSREFLAFYLAAIVVSGLAFVGIHFAEPQASAALGASGGVMAVVVLTAMHFPKLTVLVMFVIPVELRWLAIITVAIDVLGFVQGGDFVAHSAHLGGAAFGYLYMRYQWRISGWWDRLIESRRRVIRSNPQVRVYRPAEAVQEPETNLDEQVDAILQKIHMQGESSLTDKEREVLKTASQRYKNR